MAELLFNKLQILPVPQKKTKFKLKLEKGKVALQTKIINKTSGNSITINDLKIFL